MSLLSVPPRLLLFFPLLVLFREQQGVAKEAAANLPPNSPLSARCHALSDAIDNVRFHLYDPETKVEVRIFDAATGVLLEIEITPGADNGPSGPRANLDTVAEWAACHDGALVCFVLDSTREDLLLNAGMGPIHDSSRTGGISNDLNLNHDMQFLWNVDGGLSHCWPITPSGDHALQYPAVHLRDVSPGVHVLSGYIVNGVTNRIAYGEEYRSPRASAVFKVAASTRAEALQSARGKDVDPVRELYREHSSDVNKEISSNASDLVLGFYWSHDAAVTVARGDGTVLFVLELERLFNKRYFMFNLTHENTLRLQLTHTRDAIVNRLIREGFNPDSDFVFKVAVFVDHPAHARGMSRWAQDMEHKRKSTRSFAPSSPLPIFEIVRQVLPRARRWVQCDHHYAHSCSYLLVPCSLRIESPLPSRNLSQVVLAATGQHPLPS